MIIQIDCARYLFQIRVSHYNIELYNVHFLLTLRETAPSDFNGLPHGLPTAWRELLPVAIRGTGKHDVVPVRRSWRALAGWIMLQ